MKAFTTPWHRRVKRLVVVTGAWLALVTALGFVDLHDFHFSRTDMRWNPQTQTVQATLRVFTDDLELALRNHHGLGEEVKIWLGDDKEWPSADEAISAWLDANLNLSLADSTLAWTWVGKEIELDVSYLYLESYPVPGRGATWRVTNRLFFHEFADQVNEVYLQGINKTGLAAEKREMLNWELPTMVWESVDLETDATDD